MSRQPMFFLTKLERKVFFSLSDSFESVTAIASRAKEPRTSVAKALKSLEAIGFVSGKKVRDKNRHVYRREEMRKINESFEQIRSDILGKLAAEKTSLTFGEGVVVTAYSGREGVLEALYDMLALKKNERVYVIQGHDAAQAWVDFLGKEEVIKLQEKIKENELIMVSVRGENFKHHVRHHEDIVKTYLGRLSNAHVIPDKFFQEGVSVYSFKTSILFVDTKLRAAVYISNKNIALSLQKMIHFILEVTNRDAYIA